MNARIDRRWRTVVLALVLVLVLAACGGRPEAGGEGGPILIGAIFDQTGATGDVGTPYSQGVRAYVSWKNEQGGIQDRQIELISADYAYEVSRAEELYTQYVTQDGVVAFSGWGTGDTEALKGKISQDRVPFISGSFSENLADPAETPYNFLVGTTYSDQMLIAHKWALEGWKSAGNRGMPKFAYMFHDSPFGRSPVPAGQAFAEANGIETMEVPMPGGATDLTPQLTQVQEFGANYVFIQNVASPAALAVRNASDLALTDEMTFVCLNWCGNELLVEQAGDAAEGVIGVIPFAPASSGAAGAELALSYARENDIDVDSEIHYIQGWWAMAILVEGIDRAVATGEPLTGESIKAALETLENFETDGVTSPITFTAEDHRGSKETRLYRVVDGNWEPVTGFQSAD